MADTDKNTTTVSIMTFNRRIAAAKHRIRFLSQGQDFKESQRMQIERALGLVKTKKINTSAISRDRVLTKAEVEQLVAGAKNPQGLGNPATCMEEDCRCHSGRKTA